MNKIKEINVKTKQRAIRDLEFLKKTLIGSDDLFDRLWAIDLAIETLGAQVKEENTEVHVTCYGERTSFKNKDEAIDFFLEGVLNSDGAERGRYDRIIDQLVMGKTECSDEEY